MVVIIIINGVLLAIVVSACCNACCSVLSVMLGPADGFKAQQSATKSEIKNLEQKNFHVSDIEKDDAV